jgi:hypothetical protein
LKSAIHPRVFAAGKPGKELAATDIPPRMPAPGRWVHVKKTPMRTNLYSWIMNSY